MIYYIASVNPPTLQPNFTVTTPPLTRIPLGGFELPKAFSLLYSNKICGHFAVTPTDSFR